VNCEGLVFPGPKNRRRLGAKKAALRPLSSPSLPGLRPASPPPGLGRKGTRSPSRGIPAGPLAGGPDQDRKYAQGGDRSECPDQHRKSAFVDRRQEKEPPTAGNPDCPRGQGGRTGPKRVDPFNGRGVHGLAPNVRALISAGAKVNIRDEKGSTASSGPSSRGTPRWWKSFWPTARM